MGFVFKKDQPSSEFAPGVTRRIVNSDATESKMLYVSEITIAPGKAAPLVTHPDDEEGVLVVEGKLTLVLETNIPTSMSATVSISSPDRHTPLLTRATSRRDYSVSSPTRHPELR